MRGRIVNAPTLPTKTTTQNFNYWAAIKGGQKIKTQKHQPQNSTVVSDYVVKDKMLLIP